MKAEDTLRIVFVTDIHQAHENIQLMQKWHTENGLKFDVCLIGGDIVNCDHHKNSHNQQQQEKDAVLILEKIQNIFDCQMYYVPGNHDPLNFFKEGQTLSPQIVNIHGKSVGLADNLELLGFGGSVPGYLDKELQNKRWEGYPFHSNSELQKSVQETKGLTCKPESQKIVLTHCGPFSSMTTVDTKNPQSLIYGGATCFDKFLSDDSLVAYFHGHVHHGSRFVRYNERPFMNPGALGLGQFGWVQLKRNSETKKWAYSKSYFIDLKV